MRTRTRRNIVVAVVVALLGSNMVFAASVLAKPADEAGDSGLALSWAVG